MFKLRTRNAHKMLTENLWKIHRKNNLEIGLQKETFGKAVLNCLRIFYWWAPALSVSAFQVLMPAVSWLALSP
jgi:hypothetical protein